MRVYVTGDCHGDFSRFSDIPNDPDVILIILGDAGWNFWMNKTDEKKKQKFHKKYKFTVYCVRGNHEMRPSGLLNLKTEYSPVVKGWIAYEEKYPRIKYFEDWAIYTINDYRIGVIGGAYSVDKWYRLRRAGISDPKDNDPARTGWWANEMLSPTEMTYAKKFFDGEKVDFMLSHTCPLSWEPTDLFLSQVDQSMVDQSMEIFLDEIKDLVTFRGWLFGHFHADRREHIDYYSNVVVRQLYYDIIDLNEFNNECRTNANYIYKILHDGDKYL